MSSRKEITRVFLLWLPLACMWGFMAVEMPTFHSIISRLEDPKVNLAAFGFAFYLLLVIEAPILMLLPASTTLVEDRDSYLKLRNFTFILGGILSLLMVLLYQADLVHWFLLDVLETPPSVGELIPGAFFLFAPVPLFVGYRRFNQGIMISDNRNSSVALSSLVRLPAAFVFAWTFALSTGWPAAHSAALAATVAMIIESLVTRYMARESIARYCAKANEKETTYYGICLFFLPLAMTAMVNIAIHPIINVALARWPDAISCLALWPVMSSFMFFFASMTLANQEVLISQLKADAPALPPLRSFALLLCLGLITIMGAIAYSPLYTTVFEGVIGLSPALSSQALDAVFLLVLTPIIFSWQVWQRAFLLVRHVTMPVSISSLIDIAVVFTCLLLFYDRGNFSGLEAAALSYIIGKLVSCAYLIPRMKAHEEFGVRRG